MVLRSQLKDIKKIQVVKEVFRAKILGVMHYGSEVWGMRREARKSAIRILFEVARIIKHTNSLVVRGH